MYCSDNKHIFLTHYSFSFSFSFFLFFFFRFSCMVELLFLCLFFPLFCSIFYLLWIGMSWMTILYHWLKFLFYLLLGRGRSRGGMQNLFPISLAWANSILAFRIINMHDPNTPWGQFDTRILNYNPNQLVWLLV